MSVVDSFLRDAERILETAAASADRTSPEYVICLSRTGSLRILTEFAGWSLPALAIEAGAAALYHVARRGATVQVEGWSYGRKCLLSRDSSGEWWTRPGPRTAYATFEMIEAGSSSSQNERAPQVRNS